MPARTVSRVHVFPLFLLLCSSLSLPPLPSSRTEKTGQVHISYGAYRICRAGRDGNARETRRETSRSRSRERKGDGWWEINRMNERETGGGEGGSDRGKSRLRKASSSSSNFPLASHSFLPVDSVRLTMEDRRKTSVRRLNCVSDND